MPSTTPTSSWANFEGFEVGTLVMIKDLKGRTDLNGRHAKVVSAAAGTVTQGRIPLETLVVMLGGEVYAKSEQVCAKPANVMKLSREMVSALYPKGQP